jgi:hypothetical protein
MVIFVPLSHHANLLGNGFLFEYDLGFYDKKLEDEKKDHVENLEPFWEFLSILAL